MTYSLTIEPLGQAIGIEEDQTLLDASLRNGFDVVAYEHGLVSVPKAAIVQRVCAIRPPAAVEDCPLVG